MFYALPGHKTHTHSHVLCLRHDPLLCALFVHRRRECVSLGNSPQPLDEAVQGDEGTGGRGLPTEPFRPPGLVRHESLPSLHMNARCIKCDAMGTIYCKVNEYVIWYAMHTTKKKERLDSDALQIYCCFPSNQSHTAFCAFRDLRAARYLPVVCPRSWGGGCMIEPNIQQDFFSKRQLFLCFHQPAALLGHFAALRRCCCCCL